MYDPLTAAGGAGGGVTGAGLGSLGRSPFLDLLKPLDYPRQAAWNLVRGPARFLQGEGSLDDLLGMAPGLIGGAAGLLGPLGMLGGALAGGAVQGLGQLSGSPAFEASTPQDITGSEDFLPNLAVGAATDPLTYTGFGLGHRAGAKLGQSAAEEALLGGPEGALQAYRRGMPQAGFERDAAVSGLGGRNQALGQAVGDVAQSLESRPQALAAQVQQQLRPPELPGPPLEAPPSPAGPLSPEQAFEQMLPDYQRYARTQRAAHNPRNFIPAELEGLDAETSQAVRDVPTSRLNEFLAPQEFPGGEWELNDEWAGREPFSPEVLAQYRRGAGAMRTYRQASHQLEQHGPLAAELAKSGQLGPIESRLQFNRASLDDMVQEGRLSPQEFLQHTRTARLEEEAFRTLFEREPTQGNAGRAGLPFPPTGPPAFQGGSVGQLGGSPAFPPLPEILSQAQAQLGRPLQPWEVQELEQALMQRNPDPLQQRGILGVPGEGPRDVNPPLPRGADLDIQGQFTPGSQQGLGQFIEQIQERLGRPLTAVERRMVMQSPPSLFPDLMHYWTTYGGA